MEQSTHPLAAAYLRFLQLARVVQALPEGAEMDANDNSLNYATRFDLAIAAFEHTAAYDGMIANYFGTKVPSYGVQDDASEGSKFPRTINFQFIKKQDMRYGENSHQGAAFYVEADVQEASVATAT